MLGTLSVEGKGVADALMDEAARALMNRGWRLAGAVQRNVAGEDGGRRAMDLHVLASDRVVRISQNLGKDATGCSLDPGELEMAAGLAEAALGETPAPRMVIVNKFGNQEAEGKGFRPVIGQALAAGIPVLVGVSPARREAFNTFSEGMDEAVEPTLDGILAWAEQTVAEAEAL